MATPPPIDMDSETESQADLETLEPQLPKENNWWLGQPNIVQHLKVILVG